MAMEKQKQQKQKDLLEKVVVFLAKRDGTDKLVKTMQYAGKLGYFRLAASHPNLADRCQNLEIAAGLSRKAFRAGRFLTGLNALRSTSFPDPTLQVLSILGYGGEMVYWFFDHFLWLSRVGVLHPTLAHRMGYISAFGEGFGYIFFIIADLLVIRRGLQAEARFAKQVCELQELELLGVEFQGKSISKQVKELTAQISAIRMERIMTVMPIIANVSDLIIALADVEPNNPFVSHPVTLGISGLASAWSGWYRNWPDS